MIHFPLEKIEYDSLTTQMSNTKYMYFDFEKSPLSICWDITNRCNYDCKFCHREINRSELNYFEQQIILDKLLKSDVKKV